MSAAPRVFAFEVVVEAAHPALPGHFPGRPVVPGALLLSRVLAGVSAESNRPVAGVKQVKFTAALQPDEAASVECEARADEIRFAVHVARAGRPVAVAAGTLVLGGSGR